MNSFCIKSKDYYSKAANASNTWMICCGVFTCQLACVFFSDGPTVMEYKLESCSCQMTCGVMVLLGETLGEDTLKAVGEEICFCWKWAALNALNMSSSVLSSPAHMTRLVSEFFDRMRFTISPLFTDMGLTSKFFLPTKISTGYLDTMAFSRWF